MSKVRVAVLGTVGKSVQIEADAPSRAEVSAAIARAVAGIAATGSATPAQSAYPTLWRLIREIPPNISGLAAFTDTGILVRTGPGAYAARAVAVADTSRLTITAADGTGGDPTLDMADISARSVWARSANSSGKPAALQASGDKAVLAQSGTTLAFSTIDHTFVSDFDEAAQDAVGAILTDSSTIDFTYTDAGPTISASIVTNSVGNSELRQGSGTSIIGRSAGTTGNVADIAAGSDDTILRRVSGALDFGQLTVGMLPNDVVTFAKIQNATGASVLVGRGSAGGAGDFQEITLGTGLSMSGTTLSATGSTSGANPTASVGLAAVNGVATTFMRSDAAPALSQSITPTWTASHKFSANSTLPSSAPIVISNGLPVLALDETDGGTNQRYSRIYSDSGSLYFDFVNDAQNAARSFLVATRSGFAVAGVTFGNSTDNPSYTFAGTGATTWGGPLLAPAGSVGAPSHTFSGDTDTGMYAAGSNQLALTAGATQVMAMNPAGGVMRVPWGFADGSAASPAVQFDNDADTGIYRRAANAISFSVGGALVVDIQAAAVGLNGSTVIWNTLGSAASPAYTFDSDRDTGLYGNGGNAIFVSTGGSTRMTIGTALIQAQLPVRIEAAASNGAAGTLVLGNGTATTATGGSQTLPGNPAGFLTWILNGSTIKVPYYSN